MESPEDRGGGKRPRSQHPIRTTIQGLSGDVDRDLQIQNLLAAGTSSGGNGGQHHREGFLTWDGPQGHWVGPVAGRQGHTGSPADTLVVPTTGSTQTIDALDVLAGAAAVEIGDPPVPVQPPTREVASCGGGGWIGGGMPPLMSDHFGAGSAAPAHPAPMVPAAPAVPLHVPPAALATPVNPAALHMGGGMGGGAEEPGARGTLHRPCSCCRTAKVLCDRLLPCTRCVRLNVGHTCAPPPTVQRGRPSHHSRLLQLRNLAAGANQPEVDNSAVERSAPPSESGSCHGSSVAPGCVSCAAVATATPLATLSVEPLSVGERPPNCMAMPTNVAPPAAEGESRAMEDLVRSYESNIELLRKQLLSLGVQPIV